MVFALLFFLSLVSPFSFAQASDVRLYPPVSSTVSENGLINARVYLEHDGNDYWLFFQHGQKDQGHDGYDLLHLMVQIDNKAIFETTTSPDKNFRMSIDKLLFEDIQHANRRIFTIEAVKKGGDSDEVVTSMQGTIGDVILKEVNSMDRYDFMPDEFVNRMMALGDVGITFPPVQYRLAYVGITPETVKKLDLEFPGWKNSTYGSYLNSTVSSEVIALGVLDKHDYDRSGCYHSVYNFHVKKYYKVPPHLKDKTDLKVLYYNGYTESGYTEVAGTAIPKVGRTMLLFGGHDHLHYYTNATGRCLDRYGPEYLQALSDSPVFTDPSSTVIDISEEEHGHRIDGDADLTKKMDLSTFVDTYISPVLKILSD